MKEDVGRIWRRRNVIISGNYAPGKKLRTGLQCRHLAGTICGQFSVRCLLKEEKKIAEHSHKTLWINARFYLQQIKVLYRKLKKIIVYDIGRAWRQRNVTILGTYATGEYLRTGLQYRHLARTICGQYLFCYLLDKRWENNWA